MPQRKEKREGFALIVTVSIMAFVVLILLAMASLVSVETKVADNNKSFLMARQNALIGLRKAIGKLQQNAGPDQRITAKGNFVLDISDPDYAKMKNWTGIWDFPSASSFPPPLPSVWLVSDGESETTEGVVTLVGSGSTDTNILGNEIVVERKEIKTSYFPGLSGEQGIGHYAYWVGDEGVKAKANIGGSLEIDTLSPSVRKVLAQRAGIESIQYWDEAETEWKISFPLYTGEADNELKKLLTIDQISLLDGGYLTNSKRHFHDLTLHSKGVLVNPKNGALKKNLTAFFEGNVTPIEPAWKVMKSYYQLQYQVNGSGSTASIPPQTHEPSSTQHGVHPMLTQVVFGLGGSYDDASPGVNELRQQYFIGVALWNPYNIELESATYELDLGTVNGEDAVVTHRFVTNDPVSPVTTNYDFDLAKPEVDGIRSIFRGKITSGFAPGEIRVFSIDPEFGDPNFGQIVNWEDGVTLVNEWDPVATAYEVMPVNLTAVQIDADTDYSFLIPNPLPSGGTNWDNTMVRLKLLEGTNKSTIQEIQLLAGASGISGGGSSSIDGYPSTSKMVEGRMFLKQAADYSGSVLWLSDSNPRAVVHRGSNDGGPGYFPWASLFTNGGSGVFSIDVDVDPVLGTLGFAGDSRFATGSSQVILFNVPREEVGVNSIGDFQHANVTPVDYKPSFAIGNSLEDETAAAIEDDYSYTLNDVLWDEYFLATYVTGGPTLDESFTNRRFTVLDRSNTADLANFDNAATNLLIDGAFNINTISVEAWTAFLASMREVAGADAVEYHKTPFQKPLSEVDDVFNMWAAYRNLTDAQIDVLARNIVAEIEAHGFFLSLSEFVNRVNSAGTKGLLQKAIDDPGASGEASVNDGLGDERFGAPGFLTQADLLQPLGPFIQVRSDTFLVRAYGDVRNPVTGDIDGRAWCEAVVQRLPEPMDDYATYGRVFEIVMFRWLTQDEI